MDINRNNYETFFLLYLDGELNDAERAEVENFLATHADLQKEFSLLLYTVQRPAETIFESKELLYRSEEKRRLIPVYWTRIAAALLLVLASGWFLINLLYNHKQAGSASEQKVAAIGADRNHPVADSPEAGNQVVKTVTKKGSGKAEKVTNRNLPENTRTRKTNPTPNIRNDGKPQPSDNKDSQIRNESEEGLMVMQKSNATPELQTSANRNAEVAPEQLTGSGKAPALFIAAAAGNHNAVIENEYPADLPADNAISVIALNDQNKGITSFFKKITRRLPGNETAENTKKLRVSVFQFSY